MRYNESSQLSILLVTDVFPPKSGGSGWSAYYLGKALVERGHRVKVLRPRYDLASNRPVLRHIAFRGLPVEELAIPSVPEWIPAAIEPAWRERLAAYHLARRCRQLAVRGEVDVLHGQHKVSAMAVSNAVRRARSQGAGAVSVATVRDYWPLCPVSTRLFTAPDGHTFECQECHRLRPYLASMRATGKGDARSGLLGMARWLSTWHASRTRKPPLQHPEPGRPAKR